MDTLPSSQSTAYTNLLQSLAEKMQVFSLEAEAAQNRFEQARLHYQNVLDAQSFDISIQESGSEYHLPLPLPEKKKRLQREDYYELIIPYLKEHGSSHFRNIYLHLKKSFDDITEAQVNKFLNKDTIKSDSRIARDNSIPSRGYFTIREPSNVLSIMAPSISHSIGGMSPM